MYRNGDYFQFVTVPVPGPSWRGPLGLMHNTTVSKLWRAIATAAGPHIEDAARRGDIPLEDRLVGFEVYPNIEDAAKSAPQESEIREDDIVYEFELDR